MITRTDLDERVREWDLRDDVVEKDYVIGWLLWGIGSDSRLSRSWAFKGGTCLKKCYIETFRFSEDLDFTVLPGGPIAPEEVVPILAEVLRRVQEESGIDLSQREAAYRLRPDGESAEGRVYYIGPRGAPTVASVKLDMTSSERVARPNCPQDHRSQLPRWPAVSREGALLLLRGSLRRETTGHGRARAAERPL